MYYPSSELVKAGVLAEKYDLDSLWVQDHFTDLPPSGDKADPWVIMSAIGIQTQKITLSPGVTDTQRLHPAKMAHIVATLDDLTRGRAILAIGAGEAMNIVPYGLPWEKPEVRLQRLKESITVMRLLWKSSREEPVTFEGRFYRLQNAWLDQHTYQNRIPKVYIGALGSPRTLKLVGEIGDGYFPWFNTVETFRKRVKIIQDAARQAGRSLEDIDLVVLLFAAITKDESIRKRAINAIKPEICILNHRNLLKEIGYELKIGKEMDYAYQHVLATQEAAKVAAFIAEEMSDDVASQFMLVGSADECIEKINQFVEIGATHIVLRDAIGQYLFGSVEKGEETLRELKHSIMAYFRSDQ
jgi:phthiodiolone/phenolphthiodiolone dimycocerosates ketoreductase